jgi:inosine-uridine nucleoside N-ribohydrolase
MLGSLLLAAGVFAAAAQSAPPIQAIPVILDTDCGFASDDAMALLALLQSREVDLLGVTVVTGNDWLEQEVQNVLRLLEIAGRPEVPVFAGSERPLLTSREEMTRRERVYGETSDGGYKGAWREGGPGPEVVVPPDGRFASIRRGEKHASDFILSTIRARPREVVLAAIGPLTNVALALAKDPEIATLARELVVMGGGIEKLPEFNFWMDPEAARLTLRAPWSRVTLTPINIAEQAPFTLETARSLASIDSDIGRYFRDVHVGRTTAHSVTPLMYDPIAILALLEPDVVEKSEEMFLDVEVDHGPFYGATLYWDSERRPPEHVREVTVLRDLDTPRFMEVFVELMKKPPRR